MALLGFGVRVLRHWEDRREAARVGDLVGLGSAWSDFIEGALVKTNKQTKLLRPRRTPKGAGFLPTAAGVGQPVVGDSLPSSSPRCLGKTTDPGLTTSPVLLAS